VPLKSECTDSVVVHHLVAPLLGDLVLRDFPLENVNSGLDKITWNEDSKVEKQCRNKVDKGKSILAKNNKWSSI